MNTKTVPAGTYELDIDYTELAEIDIDSGRWSRYFWTIFRDESDGLTWGVREEAGLTEYQEVDDRFSDRQSDGSVMVYRFEEQVVTKTEWVQVK